MRTDPRISEDCQSFPKSLFKMPIEAPKYLEIPSRKSEPTMKKESLTITMMQDWNSESLRYIKKKKKTYVLIVAMLTTC